MKFIEISNKQGLTAYLLPYGATLARLTFPDKNGKHQDLVLGYNSINGFKNDKVSMGKTVGRVANRIKNAQLEFDGKIYELEKNNGPHFLHGGSNGPCHKEWEVVRHSPRSVSFSIKIDEVDDGLPGDAKIDVTYTVNDRSQLIVEHFATCTKPGVLALTNHSYWNLDGSETIGEHILEVESAEYVAVDESACPTGEILNVSGTKFDFQKPKKLKETIDSDGLISIDNDLIIKKTEPPSTPTSHLRLRSEKSGIEMSITTSYPTIHLYAAKYLDLVGRDHEKYKANKAIAIEPQFHSASPNYKSFPDISLQPGQQYSQEIVYTFTHIL